MKARLIGGIVATASAAAILPLTVADTASAAVSGGVTCGSRAWISWGATKAESSCIGPGSTLVSKQRVMLKCWISNKYGKMIPATYYGQWVSPYKKSTVSCGLKSALIKHSVQTKRDF